MEGYLAEIRMFGGNFAPRGWMLCQGQLLSIAQWTAVFALLGTTFGGNGQTTFGLPDFRGRLALGTGQGPGLANVDLGEMAGVENVTLISSQMPQHNHVFSGTVTNRANNNITSINSDPDNRRLAQGNWYTANTNALVNMANDASTLAMGISGGSQPFSIRSPYLGLEFIICVEGIFPSRN